MLCLFRVYAHDIKNIYSNYCQFLLSYRREVKNESEENIDNSLFVYIICIIFTWKYLIVCNKSGFFIFNAPNKLPLEKIVIAASKEVIIKYPR